MKKNTLKRRKTNESKGTQVRTNDGDRRKREFPFTIAAWIVVVILFFLGVSYVRERQKPVALDIPKFETANHSQ